MKTFSETIKQRKTDEWHTKKEDVKLIVPYLIKKDFKKILCPFDKEESNFNKVLSDNGFNVVCSHIDDGTDFFQINNFVEYDAVVSNPPFSKREKIFDKLFNEKIPFALIMDLNGLFDSKKRWEMFKNNGIELLIPQGRMKFFNDNCEGKSPLFQSAYVCKNILDKQIVFAERRTE